MVPLSRCLLGCLLGCLVEAPRRLRGGARLVGVRVRVRVRARVRARARARVRIRDITHLHECCGEGLVRAKGVSGEKKG